MIPKTIDGYIATSPPKVRPILKRIRKTIREAAPQAEEIISYRMPGFRQGGVLVYFAAFKEHIGLYPPVRGNSNLEKKAAPYAGEKGNLRFPLDRPIPYDLIAMIVAFRVRENAAKTKVIRRKNGGE